MILRLYFFFILLLLRVHFIRIDSWISWILHDSQLGFLLPSLVENRISGFLLKGIAIDWSIAHRIEAINW